MEGLEAISKIKKLVNDVQYASKIPSIDKELKSIEAELKTLEILKHYFKINLFTSVVNCELPVVAITSGGSRFGISHPVMYEEARILEEVL